MKRSLCFLVLSFMSLYAEPLQLPEGNCEKVFSFIYDKGVWGYNKEDGSSSSGWGSWMVYTRPYIRFLENFMKNNNIKSVTDVGCGDWIFSRHICWDQINYTGIDVVKSVIERNKETFSSPNIHFAHQDILHADLPQADLLICKDVLQHLTNADIELFLTKIKKFKYCLITNDIVVAHEGVKKKNKEVPRLGQNRPLDLTKPPFNLKAVKAMTYPVGADHVKQVLYIKN